MSFEDALATERKSLTSRKQEVERDIAGLQQDLADITRQLKAMDTFEKSRNGRTKLKRPSIRKLVVETITNAGGISRADLLDRLGAKGDPSAEKSVSNALTNLVKSNTIQNTSGTYTI